MRLRAPSIVPLVITAFMFAGCVSEAPHLVLGMIWAQQDGSAGLVAGHPVSFHVGASFDRPQDAPKQDIEWDFGDGNHKIGNPVTHEYTTPGIYIVRATHAGRESDLGVRIDDVWVAEAVAAPGQSVSMRHETLKDALAIEGYLIVGASQGLSVVEVEVRAPDGSLAHRATLPPGESSSFEIHEDTIQVGTYEAVFRNPDRLFDVEVRVDAGVSYG